MKRLSKVLQMTAAVLAVCLVATAPAQADISNGDFSAGDDFWTVPTEDYDYDTHDADGDAYWIELGDEDAKVVGFDGFVATLEESPLYGNGGPSFTRIQQDVTLLEGETTLRFDFEVSGGGAESDYFDVLLAEYSSDGTLGTPTLFNIISSHQTGGGSVTDVAMLDVSHFARNTLHMLTFQITGYADDDSPMFVEIDNVQLVPVPGAVILGGLGLFTAGWFCRRERKV